MALLTTYAPSDAGTTYTSASADAGGDTFVPGDRTVVLVTNLSGGALTVTFDSVTPSNYGTDENTGASVGASTSKMFGPFPANRFANATTGLVNVTYSGVTGLFISVMTLG